MSMWINLARVTPEAFQIIENDPHLLGPLLMQQDDEVLARLGVAPEDISGLDYDSAEQMIEATAELAAAEAETSDATPAVGHHSASASDARAGAKDDEDEDRAAANDADDDGRAANDDDGDGYDDIDDGDDDDHAASPDDDEEQGDLVLGDLGIAGTLAYDAGFGSAFYLTPAAAKHAAATSASLDLDDEAKAIVEAAGERGHYIVGVVS